MEFIASEQRRLSGTASLFFHSTLFCFTVSGQIGTDRGEVMEEQSVNITGRVMRYA